jgi:NAD(P)-dependent dehydrogenase (short-subunit alcohol dehydrogenase family)
VRFLVTGALGQIGTELTQALRARHGADAVLATDVRPSAGPPSGPFSLLDARDRERLGKLARDHEATWIIHLAALLSASGEANPELAWDLNIGSLRGALEVARELGRLIEEVNARVAEYERLGMLVVADEPWSIENGCLTPTMKLKRARVEANVEGRVGRWYEARQPVIWA